MSRQLARLLALQAASTTIIAGAVFVWGSYPVAIAALLGGASAGLAAIAYGAAYWLQGRGKTESPLRSFLLAEMCRIVVAVTLLGIGMATLPAESAIAFLGAFVAALMAYLLIFLF
jgi:F0F1-type ATP synthase assembly protein I